MKKITMTSGAEYFAVTEPFQSSEFAGAPYPEGHPAEGLPMFTLPLVIFLDVEGNQISLVAGHIESITDINVVQPANEPAPAGKKLAMPGNVPVKRND